MNLAPLLSALNAIVGIVSPAHPVTGAGKLSIAMFTSLA
jgi:hypothetical protein